MSFSKKIFLLVFCLFLPGLAQAADPIPGAACTTANSFMLSGAPENSGIVYLMTCQGGVWVRVLETSTGGNVGIKQATPQAALDVNGQMLSRRYALTDAATVAVDWNNGNVQSVTLVGNRTFTFANGQDGARYVLIIKQDATGSRTVTWPASVRWATGAAPTLTTTASKTDYVSFVYNGVDSKYDGTGIAKNY
jgi:hypothetical protein